MKKDTLMRVSISVAASLIGTALTIALKTALKSNCDIKKVS